VGGLLKLTTNREHAQVSCALPQICLIGPYSMLAQTPFTGQVLYKGGNHG